MATSPTVLGQRRAVLDEARRFQVWRRQDLCAHVGEPHVQAQLAARRWQSPLPLVVVVHNGPLNAAQRMWTVLLSGPPGTLSRRGRCRNRRIIAESILDADGGMHSLPEREFDALRRRLLLPEPMRQQVVRRRDGRYFLDAEWPDLGIRVEIHGIPHSWVAHWDDDLLRQNDISLDGGLLVFSSYALRHREPRAAGQLVALFKRRGWSG